MRVIILHLRKNVERFVQDGISENDSNVLVDSRHRRSVVYPSRKTSLFSCTSFNPFSMGCKGERCPWTIVVALGAIKSSWSTSIEALLWFKRNELLFSSFIRGAEWKVIELTSVVVVMVYKKNQRFAQRCSFGTVFKLEKRERETKSIKVEFSDWLFLLLFVCDDDDNHKTKKRRRETVCIYARNNHSNGNKKNNVSTQTVKETGKREK